MSGGHFNYNQFRINEMVHEVQAIIDCNFSEELDAYGDKISYDFPQDVIDKFIEAVYVSSRAEKMLTRIDWLLSCDDSVESFRRHWDADGLNENLTINRK